MNAFDPDRAARDGFTAEFGHDPAVVVSSPGRINLIGEHTDYNDGFVLPLALGQATHIAAARVDGGVARLISVGHPPLTLALDGSGDDATGWGRYVQSVLRLLHDEGVAVPGFEASLATDLPVGASVSSSASLEVGLLRLCLHLSGVEMSDADVAVLAHRVEADYVGLPVGIMDMLIVAAGREGCALLIDCRSLGLVAVPIPPELTVVVLDTSTRRELVGSAYADRRASCERVAAELGVAALRDADQAALDAAADRIDPVDLRRARHVVDENDRVLAAVAALRAGDADHVGELLVASHRSLRDDFEVSGPALDAMVEAALIAPGCRGARMTGGGFAGCAIALVDTDRLDAFVPAVIDRFRTATGLEPAVYPARPSAGTSIAPA